MFVAFRTLGRTATGMVQFLFAGLIRIKVPEATLQARLEAEVGHMGPLPPYGHRLAGCFLVLYLTKVVKNPF
jgi:hypothetical protein